MAVRRPEATSGPKKKKKNITGKLFLLETYESRKIAACVNMDITMTEAAVFLAAACLAGRSLEGERGSRAQHACMLT